MIGRASSRTSGQKGAPDRSGPARLFVIGDSISLHYGPYLERLVAQSFRYGRKRAQEPLASSGHGASVSAPGVSASSLDYPDGAFGDNAGDSGMVLTYLRAAPVRVAEADVVLLNCGLHDLKVHAGSGVHQVSLDDYTRNLAAIVETLAGTKASTVWCSITPVHDPTHARHGAELTFSRVEADVLRYNRAAVDVMRAAHVPVIDLHAVTLRLAGDDLAAAYDDHVHFRPWMQTAQAAFIAGWLTRSWYRPQTS